MRRVVIGAALLFGCVGVGRREMPSTAVTDIVSIPDALAGDSVSARRVGIDHAMARFQVAFDAGGWEATRGVRDESVPVLVRCFYAHHNYWDHRLAAAQGNHTQLQQEAQQVLQTLLAFGDVRGLPAAVAALELDSEVQQLGLRMLREISVPPEERGSLVRFLRRESLPNEYSGSVRFSALGAIEGVEARDALLAETAEDAIGVPGRTMRVLGELARRGEAESVPAVLFLRFASYEGRPSYVEPSRLVHERAQRLIPAFGTAAFEPLMAMLRGENPEVERAAAIVVEAERLAADGSGAPVSPEAHDSRGAMPGPRRRVVRSALRALGALGDARAEQPLRAHLQSNDVLVRLEAAAALLALQKRTVPTAIEVGFRAISEIGAADGLERTADEPTRYFLRRLGDAADEPAMVALGSARANGSTDRVAMEAARQYANLASAEELDAAQGASVLPEGARRLLERCDVDGHCVLRELADAVEQGWTGRGAQAGVLGRAAGVLLRFGAEGPGAQEQLVSLLNHRAAELRRFAAQVLASTAQPSLLARLAERRGRVDETLDEVLLWARLRTRRGQAVVSDREDASREDVSEGDETGASEELAGEAALGSLAQWRRLAAFEQLEAEYEQLRQGPGARDALAAMRDRVGTPLAEAYLSFDDARAARLLCHLKDSRGVFAAVQGLRDSRRGIAEACLGMLRDLAVPEEQRAAAVARLQTFFDVASAAEKGDGSRHLPLVEGIGAVGGEVARDALVRLLLDQDQDSTSRRIAAEELGRLGDVGAANALSVGTLAMGGGAQVAFDDEVSEASVMGLALLGRPAYEATLALYEGRNAEAMAVARARVELRRAGGDAGATVAAEVAIPALRAFGLIGDPRAFPIMLAAVRGDEPRVHVAAADALSRLQFGRRGEVVTELVRLLRREDGHRFVGAAVNVASPELIAPLLSIAEAGGTDVALARSAGSHALYLSSEPNSPEPPHWVLSELRTEWERLRALTAQCAGAVRCYIEHTRPNQFNATLDSNLGFFKAMVMARASADGGMVDALLPMLEVSFDVIEDSLIAAVDDLDVGSEQAIQSLKRFRETRGYRRERALLRQRLITRREAARAMANQ